MSKLREKINEVLEEFGKDYRELLKAECNASAELTRRELTDKICKVIEEDDPGSEFEDVYRGYVIREIKDDNETFIVRDNLYNLSGCRSNRKAASLFTKKEAMDFIEKNPINGRYFIEDAK